MSALAAWSRRIAPRSLSSRVFALYGATLAVFFSAGLALFLTKQYEELVEEKQQAGVMLIEVVAQAVRDSVVIGDYDTVRRTLQTTVQGPIFTTATFIDLNGGRIEATMPEPLEHFTPDWFITWVESRFQEMNRAITVGGKDYGVLRLRFDSGYVASDLWSLSVQALAVALVSLGLGLATIRLLLRRWLGGLDRLRHYDQALAAGTLDASRLRIDEAPEEVQHVLDLFRRTAELLREREESRRALDNQKFALDQHAIVSITDLEGRITYANDRFCQITGYSREELLGRNHRIINSGTQSRAFFQQLWQTIAAGQVWHGEICNRNCAGGLYWVNATIVPLLGDDGRPAQYIAIRTEITARVLAERKLGELNADLESVIGRRTQALEEATLLASQANRAKSEFLSNMSHEMRTPMNSILGMAFLALRASPSPQVRQYLTHISDSGRYLLELISSILDFSKIESGKLELEAVDFSLPAVARAAAALMEESASQKSLVLRVDIDPALERPLRGDPLRLRQVLLNYLGNAVKFSPRGEIRLYARAVQRDDAGVVMRLEVRDPGIGMSADELERVFQPFHQADSSTSRRFGGTGLGLAICRKIADAMRGQVGADSVPGQGSTFWLETRLPWGQALALAAPEPDATSLPQRWTQALGGARVLVVDDNALNLTVAAELLEAAGARVLLAGDGRRALDVLSAEPVDCVLMDMQMPEMDGLETTRQIRDVLGLDLLPVVAMTANARREDRNECLAAGMDDFVTKPVVPETLYATVARWVRVRPAAPASPGPAHPLAVSASDSNPIAPVPGPAPGPQPEPPSAPPAAAEPDVLPVFDPSVLQALTRSNPKAVEAIARAYRQLMGSTLPQLEQAVAAGDAEALRQLGHKLKSSSASLGAPALAQACRQLEAATARGAADLPRAAALVDRIVELAPQVEAALERLTQAADPRA
jgi:two-component system sensor histidine kinase/response regulator